ncbi:thioesterase family protein [soil metagenome]
MRRPSSQRPAHFAQIDEDRYQPGPFAESHWGEDHLNGPAVVGLAGYALEKTYGLPEFVPARLTVDLFKAAKSVPTTCKTSLVRNGRRVRNSGCELVQDGVTVARATLVQYRIADAPRGEEWVRDSAFTRPPELNENRGINIGSDGLGWTSAIVDHQNAARKRCFNRTIDVVDGVDNSPFIRAIMAAEGTSLVTNLGTEGVGYINGDLTVALSRLPQDAWIGVEADTHWVANGISVGTATLFDTAGAFGTGMVTAVSNPAAQIDFGNDPFPNRTR